MHLGVENKLLVRRDDVTVKFDHGAHLGRFHSRNLIHSWNKGSGHDMSLMSYFEEGNNLRLLDDEQLKQYQLLRKREEEKAEKEEMSLLLAKMNGVRIPATTGFL